MMATPNCKIKKGYIIESGSNANGEYVKFSDGTLICRMSIRVQDQAINEAYGSLFRGTRIWQYPVPFVATPSVSCGEFRWNTGSSWGGIMGRTATQATLVGTDIASRPTGFNCNICAMAIGRWKE